jgi:hypothetical protein
MKDYCEQYQVLAGTLYRECSEYVHGNHSSYEGVDAGISFNISKLDSWLDRADTARMVVKFAFLTRYLLHVDRNVQNILEELALDQFQYCEPIRDVFSGAMNE